MARSLEDERQIPEGSRPGHRPRRQQDKPSGPPPVAGVKRGPGREWRFRFGRVNQALALPFGVLPATTWVRIGDDHLEVRFGPWVLRTPVDNLAGAEVTGPYSLQRVAGGPRLAREDSGATFATNTEAGTCICFRRPVSGALPFGLRPHEAATVTVDDPADLADVVNRLAARHR